MTQNSFDTFDHSPKRLDVISFPLHGHRLIEASAGTGKTYTIANLYLRLLTGHGDEQNKASKPVTPKEILVVTFTEAATQELRERIRSRIHLAQNIFAGKKPVPNDPFLQQLYIELPDHKKTAKQLLIAERHMDEASIYTIHGFCNRMLSQHAFESGSLFNTTLVTDESQLLKQAVNNYWRTRFYEAPSYETDILYGYWKTPSALLSHLQAWLNHQNATILTHDNLSFSERCRQVLKKVRFIKQLWLDCCNEVVDSLNKAGLHKGSFKPEQIDKYAREITDWANKQVLTIPKNLEKFSSSFIQKKKTSKGTLPEHSFFNAVQELLDNPLDFKDILIKEAIQGIKQHLSKLKLQHHVTGFNDLLTAFDAALLHPDNIRLRQQLRHCYPVALIDEFQDTDSLQYRIFKTLYPNNDNTLALLMIGDPKQAIYAFRGGDIFTYINVRRNTPDRYTLPTNWRSSEEIIKACNHIFTTALKPFIFDADIPFSPVNASPQANDRFLMINNKPTSALELWSQKDNYLQAVSKEQYKTTMTENTVAEIKYLLKLSDENKCTLTNNNTSRNIKGSDIAVLVRTGAQAKKIKTALANAGIASVYMSERDSVFNTREALDIYRILQACLFPENERLLRTALSTSLLNMTAPAIEALRENEAAWEQVIEEFVSYSQIWQKQGVLSLLRTLMFNRKITQKLLHLPLGERRLTDIIHLGETLSVISETIETPQALSNWLLQHIQQNDKDETFQLHFESDKNLVKIITIHKSKGLEYPIIFMPYICELIESGQKKGYFFHAQPNNRPTLDLTLDDANKSYMEKENLAEDIRLFYVGITRAIYKCYLGIAPVIKGKIGKNATKNHLHKTALGYLLNDGCEIPANTLNQLISDRWSKNDQMIQLSGPPLNTENAYHKILPTDSTLQTKTFSLPVERNWTVTSYSSLSAKSQHIAFYERPGLEDDLISCPVTAKTDTEPEYNIFTFPKGASTGVFLHALFEAMSFSKAKTTPPEKAIKKALLHEGFEPIWQETLEKLVIDVLNTPLYPQLFSLGDIKDNCKYAEMEFYLPLSPLSAKPLNQLLQQYDPLSGQAEQLSFPTIQGMLKGFIDLIFIHNNKYYIADYKSNHLGDSLEDYGQNCLEEVMVKHRYDFQYQLYTLALHRLLQQRLPDYHYETHIGGVYYLYLRGMNPEKNKTGVFYTRPRFKLINALDQMFQGEIYTEDTKAC